MASERPDDLTPPPALDPPTEVDRPTGLSARQERGLVALLNETTIMGAAKASGIPERTLHHWLKDPVFKGELRRLRREAFSQAVALAQRYSPMAMTVLAQIANDKSAPHSARAQACNSMLKYGRESIELDDLAARVESLEGQHQGGPAREP